MIKALFIFCPLFLLIPFFALSQNEDFKISTNVDLVLLDVSVKDTKGGYVSGLSKDNFKIEENGIPQKITTFANQDVPVEVGLVLDDSGSMRPKRGEVNVAALTFVNASNPQDQVFTLDFNDKVLPGLPSDVPFTDSIELLHMALSQHRAEGRTVLYDAVAAGLRYLENGQRARKTLVIISDGGDTASRLKFPDVLRMIEESHATIYTVGMFDSDDPDKNPGVLHKIANVSGGECFLLDRYQDIVPTCKRIAQDIRKRYTIGYVPDRGNDKSALHKIHVTASASDRGKLVVHTRTNYIDATPELLQGK